MRKKILAANWKMNLTHVEAESYVEAFLNEVGEINDVEIVIIPSFTSIPTLVQATGKAPGRSEYALGAKWRVYR
jgi:triosephosphate isomerase (TIM)